MNPIRQQAIAELRRIVPAALGEHDAAVWLFGSCARGEPRQHSDIDIAILPRDQLPIGFFSELQADLEQRLAEHAALLRRWLTALQARAAASG